MTSTMFAAKLTSKFPEYNGKGTDELVDIVDSLTGYPNDSLDTLWNEFRDTYTYGTAPRRAVFVKLARDLQLRKHSRNQTNSHEFVCYVCDARFSLNLTTCPKCSNRDKTYRSIIKVGNVRSGKLKGEIDSAREDLKSARTGRNPYAE